MAGQSQYSRQRYQNERLVRSELLFVLSLSRDSHECRFDVHLCETVDFVGGVSCKHSILRDLLI